VVRDAAGGERRGVGRLAGELVLDPDLLALAGAAADRDVAGAVHGEAGGAVQHAGG
jgi:hypothetical protein